MDFSAFCKQLIDAAHGGNWKYAVALALVAAVSGIRWLAPKLHSKVGDFLNSDRGGVCLAFAAAMCGAVASAFGAGKGIDMSLATDAFGVALAAIGGYSGVKKLFS